MDIDITRVENLAIDWQRQRILVEPRRPGSVFDKYAPTELWLRAPGGPHFKLTRSEDSPGEIDVEISCAGGLNGLRFYGTPDVVLDFIASKLGYLQRVDVIASSPRHSQRAIS